MKLLSILEEIKKLSFVTICFMIVSSLNAQQRNCGTMEYLNLLQSNNPKLKTNIKKNEFQLQKWIKNNSIVKSTV